MRVASRRVARVAAALLGLAALSAADSVSHCFRPSSVGGSCQDGEMLCFETAWGLGMPQYSNKVLRLMGTVEHLEKVQAKIEALSGRPPGQPQQGGQGAGCALRCRLDKSQARVAKQLKQLAWYTKGVCKNMDLCKWGTFVPTVEGDAFENIFCFREVPAQPGEEDDYGCERMVGIPATLPAITCHAFFPDNP
jgi:hypothetical protein